VKLPSPKHNNLGTVQFEGALHSTISLLRPHGASSRILSVNALSWAGGEGGRKEIFFSIDCASVIMQGKVGLPTPTVVPSSPGTY